MSPSPRLHGSGRRWVPIVDCGITALPGQAYPPYDRGLAAGVFLRDSGGRQPLLGQVGRRAGAGAGAGQARPQGGGLGAAGAAGVEGGSKAALPVIGVWLCGVCMRLRECVCAPGDTGRHAGVVGPHPLAGLPAPQHLRVLVRLA